MREMVYAQPSEVDVRLVKDSRPAPGPNRVPNNDCFRGAYHLQDVCGGSVSHTRRPSPVDLLTFRPDSGRQTPIMSRVTIDETAISSAEAALVAAMKTMMRIATAPPVPATVAAAAGAGKPAETCEAERA